MSEDTIPRESTQLPSEKVVRPDADRREIPYLQLTIPEGATLEQMSKIRDINGMLTCFAILGVYAASFREPWDASDYPSGKSAGSDRFRKLYTDRTVDTPLDQLSFKDILDVMGNLQRLATSEDKADIAEKEKIYQEIEQLAEMYALPTQTQIVEIDEGGVDLFFTKMARVRHDFRIPITVLKLGLDVYKHPGNADSPKVKGEFLENAVRDVVEDMTSSYESLTRYLEDEYDTNIFTADEIGSTVMRSLAVFSPSKKRPTLELPDDLVDLQMEWSDGWCELLSINIAQNINKSFVRLQEENIQREEKSRVTFKKLSEEEKGAVGIEDNKEYIEIDFEDSGIGIPPEIEENGFQNGVSNWGDSQIVSGNGIGMAFHANVLREHYGGRLIPENIRDQQGQVVGARIRVLLPISSLSGAVSARVN